MTSEWRNWKNVNLCSVMGMLKVWKIIWTAAYVDVYGLSAFVYIHYTVVECQGGSCKEVKPVCRPTASLTQTPHNSMTEDQISDDTVNLMPCSIVWKGIIARHTNPQAVRDKYWHSVDWYSHNKSVWLFQSVSHWCHTDELIAVSGQMNLSRMMGYCNDVLALVLDLP